MSTAASAAYGTTLNWNSVEVGELQSITGPTQKGKAIDATNMDSPSGFAEYVMGIIDGGTIQVDGNFTNATGQANLRTDFQAKTSRTVVITLPTTHTWTATAMCIDLDEDHKVADRITFKASFQITGKPTFA
ncbi:MAG TPA: phage tail tube protein [Terriglobia bacterium]|nr:phage tail tube protein [Terriglobia bacterium]